MSPHVPARQPRHDSAGSIKPSNAKLDALNKVVVVHIDVESPHVGNYLIVLFVIVDSSQSLTMDNEGIRTPLEESLQELLKENDAIRSEIKKLVRKHSINHAKIDAIMEELTTQETEKESFLMKLWRQLLKFLLGKISPRRKTTDSGLGLNHLLSEIDQTVPGLGGQRPPSLCQPMELEDANLTLSGSVQTINDTEELMKEMTPWRKKIRIIVEDEDGVCEEVSYRIVYCRSKNSLEYYKWHNQNFEHLICVGDAFPSCSFS